MTAADPLAVETLVTEAIVRQRAGLTGAAEGLFRQALAAHPAHPEANHNLGVLLAQRGELASALAHFSAALRNDTQRELYWLSYARAQFLAGDAAAAGATLAAARAQGHRGPAAEALSAQIAAATPSDPQRRAAVHLRTGDLLAEQGRLAEAVDSYGNALAEAPDLVEAHHHLGSVLAETGRIAEGFSHLMRCAELVRGADDPAIGAAAPPHKAKHDREQRAYLAARGAIAPDTPDPPFHLGDGGRIAGPAVNPGAATPQLLEAWREQSPQLVVIDGFLTPAALENLRSYCADSTMWRRIYDAGYLGATPLDGLAAPLLAQIAEEIGSVYAAILSGHPFRYLGAFKYDSELSTGTNTHADFSAVNVNLYIAPDAANLEPESGGMLVWDVEAASEAEMRRFNSDEPALRAHLAGLGAQATRIPHRANRAIFFRSSLFHKTDECRFADGYLNKRINVSLLYGDWGAPTR